MLQMDKRASFLYLLTDVKSYLSVAEKHPDFGVTACLQNDTTNIKFDD